MFFSPYRNTSFVYSDARITPGDGVEIIGLQNLSKAFTVFAVFLVKADAIFNNPPYLLLIINTGKFPGKLGVPAELAPQLNTVSFLTFCQSASGACRNALAAFEAESAIDDRAVLFRIEKYCVFLAGFNTGFTHRAGFIGDHWGTCADYPDIFDLWLGACIRAVRQRNSKVMVKL